MSQIADMFPGTKPPRAKPRVMMHMIDAGYAAGQIGHFMCAKCGHDSDWVSATDTELRRGIPCPVCNGLADGQGVEG